MKEWCLLVMARLYVAKEFSCVDPKYFSVPTDRLANAQAQYKAGKINFEEFAREIFTEKQFEKFIKLFGEAAIATGSVKMWEDHGYGEIYNVIGLD
jgi:hypothetical protein